MKWVKNKQVVLVKCPVCREQGRTTSSTPLACGLVLSCQHALHIVCLFPGLGSWPSGRATHKVRGTVIVLLIDWSLHDFFHLSFLSGLTERAISTDSNVLTCLSSLSIRGDLSWGRVLTFTANYLFLLKMTYPQDLDCETVIMTSSISK